MKHYILIGSAYNLGQRIALHFTEQKDIDDIFKKHKRLIEEYQVSIHIIETGDKSWESVVENDKFFDNIKVKSSKEFFKLLKQNKEITSLDVAYYVLSKCQCCHTKLEKLVYYCYADYYVKTKTQLFNDKIYAFDYGPVVNSVFKKFKMKYDLANDKQIQENFKEAPLRSRILASDDGVNKIYSINETLNKYSNLTASNLVELTHREDTPWSNTPKGRFKLITDKSIELYHKNETI